MVRNFTCPVGSVVREEQCVCRAMAAFFSEATGMLSMAMSGQTAQRQFEQENAQ